MPITAHITFSEDGATFSVSGTARAVLRQLEEALLDSRHRRSPVKRRHDSHERGREARSRHHDTRDRRPTDRSPVPIKRRRDDREQVSRARRTPSPAPRRTPSPAPSRRQRDTRSPSIIILGDTPSPPRGEAPSYPSGSPSYEPPTSPCYYPTSPSYYPTTTSPSCSSPPPATASPIPQSSCGFTFRVCGCDVIEVGTCECKREAYRCDRCASMLHLVELLRQPRFCNCGCDAKTHLRKTHAVRRLAQNMPIRTRFYNDDEEYEIEHVYEQEQPRTLLGIADDLFRS